MRAIRLVLVTALVAAAAGCAPQPTAPRGTTTTAPSPSAPPSTTGTPTTTPPSPTTSTAEATLPPLPPASDFVSAVTNPWYPLPPGAKWTYTGVKDGKPTSDTILVTDKTKTILGIPAVVVMDTLTSEGRVVEATADWFAQDKQGNVWYLGEATRTFRENGSVETTEGSWEAGVAGAKPGIFMPAVPAVGQSFKQESAKDVAEDQFAIVSLNATTTVPLGSFSGAMKTLETTPLEPDVKTEKFYVKGIGLIYENDVTGPPEYNKLVTFTK